jgi:hypothetical protein
MLAIFASGFFGFPRRRQREARASVVAEFRPRNQRRRRAAGVIAFATLIGAVLAGCHHKTNTTVVGTPNGAITMVIQGQALDASGNALSTSRPMPQIILDVETK